MFEPKVPTITLDDVGGLEDLAQEMISTIRSAMYHNNGDKSSPDPPVPRSAMLFGLPGTGKSLFAQAIAHACSARIIRITSTDWLNIGWAGDPIITLKEVFDLARSVGPCILFLDDIDGISPARVRIPQTSNVARPPTDHELLFEQLLTELDHFNTDSHSQDDSQSNQLFVLAATDRPDLIDPYLLEHNHLAHTFVIPLPDLNARLSILRIALRNVILSPSVDLTRIANATEGFHGADLVEVCQRAIKMVIREAIEREDQERERRKGEAMSVKATAAAAAAAGETLVERDATAAVSEGGEEGEEKEDPLEVTPVHFEGALKYARRSMTDEWVRRFEMDVDKLRFISSP